MTAFDHMKTVVKRAAMMGQQYANTELHGFLEHASGVIHVGASIGQERQLYEGLELPVVWIEPIPFVYEILCEQLAGCANQRALPYLITDVDRKQYRFGIANNCCQSSSIYDLKGHKKLWADIGFVAAVDLESRTLASVIEQHGLDLSIYDTLVCDVQGAELLVLKGAGDYLSRFKWIMTEAADFEAYHDGCQLADIEEYLLPRGFERERIVELIAKESVGTYWDVVYRKAA